MKKNRTIDPHGAFASVTLADDFGHAVPRKNQEMLFEALDSCLERFSALKQDARKCRSMSNETGHDLAAGFAFLEQSAMTVTSHCTQNAANFDYQRVIDTSEPDKPVVIASSLSVDLNIMPLAMRTYGPKNLRTMIGHELGHSLMTASGIKENENAPDINDLFSKTSYQSGPSAYKTNYALEFNADKFGLVLNPEGTIGEWLAITGKTFWNKLYVEAPLPLPVAKLFAGFCDMRDRLCHPLYSRMSPKSLFKLNTFFMMEMGETHPAPIVRAVKGEQFARRLAALENS